VTCGNPRNSGGDGAGATQPPSSAPASSHTGCGRLRPTGNPATGIPGDGPGDIDAYVAARLLPGLRPVTVRKWAQLGQLERRGVDAKRRTLYRFADIERLWLDRVQARGSFDRDHQSLSH
jgi:hypothetical protein